MRRERLRFINRQTGERLRPGFDCPLGSVSGQGQIVLQTLNQQRVQEFLRHTTLGGQEVCGDLLADGADENENLFFVLAAVVFEQAFAEPWVRERQQSMLKDDLAKLLSHYLIHGLSSKRDLTFGTPEVDSGSHSQSHTAPRPDIFHFADGISSRPVLPGKVFETPDIRLCRVACDGR